MAGFREFDLTSRVGALLLTLSMTALGAVVWHRFDTRPVPASQPTSPRLRSGTDEVAILLASSTCGASQTPGFDVAARRALAILRDSARVHSRQFATVGVSLDDTPAVGAQYLERFGAFSSLVVGRGWLNPGVVSYVWRDSPGAPSLPQIVVVRRRVDVGIRKVSVGADSVVLRIVGTQQIMDWVSTHSPRRRTVTGD